MDEKNQNQDNFEFEKYPEDENDGVFAPEESDVNHEEQERERERRKTLREKRKEEERKKQEEKEKRKKNTKVTLIVFGILLFVIWLVYYALTNMMPGHLMNQGKKYYDVKEYSKALRMFKMASDARPYDDEPVYYQALALSKLEPTYENQKALYEISQLDNYDKASAFADEVLSNMKKQLDKKVGSNYIGNVMYDDVLYRWNTKEPITYYIATNNAPKEYSDAIRKGFSNWSAATNSEIMFKEISNNDNANISIYLLDGALRNSNDIKSVGSVHPIIKDDVLEKVEINVKTGNNSTNYYDINKFKVLAQHEIGHALGIWGHSSNPNDLMYHTNDYIDEINPNQGITQRDLNTLTLLYKMVPDAINTPLSPDEYKKLFYHYVITAIPGQDFELEMQRLIDDLKYDPQNIVKWVDLAINYGIKKQYQRSNSILHKVLSLTKNDIHNQFVVLYNLAANYYKMKEYSYAEKFLNLATMFSEDMDTQILEAFIDLKQNRKEIGKGKLQVLNNKYPDNVEISLKLAEIYYSDKERVKAKEVIDKLVQVNPDSKRDRRVAKYRNFNAKTIKEKPLK